MIIPEKEFALAVVSSSDSQLSLEEKAKLYEEALNFIIKRNSSFTSKASETWLKS